MIRRKGGSETDIGQRIACATRAFGAMKKQVFQNKMIQKEVKKQVYTTMILPILLYGSETWAPTMKDIQKLEVFHTRSLRSITGHSRLEGIPNRNIRKEAGQNTVEVMLRKNRLRWLGHVGRMTEQRTPREILDVRLTDGKRNRGGFKQRWQDKVQEDLKQLQMQNWEEVCLDRCKWRSIVGKCQSEDEDEFVCPQCNQACQNQSGLTRHIKSQHTKQRKLKFLEEIQ